MSNLRDYFHFRSFYPVSADIAKASSYAIQSTDLNFDGYKDVFFLGATYPIGSNLNTTPQNGIFFWGSNNYKYSLEGSQAISIPKTVHPRELAFADFNEDGKLDIFIADHGWDINPYPGGQNQLILSTENGWELASSKLPQRQDYTHSTAVGDINNDGNIDVFLGNIDTGTAPYSNSILLGDGKGNFSESTSMLPSEIQGANAIRTTAVQFSDVNNDGWTDLIYGNDGNTYNSKLHSSIYWNNKGVFTNSNSSKIPNGYFGEKNEQILDIQAGDLDGDGIKEIVSLSTQLNPFYDGWSLQTLRLTGEVVSDFTTNAFGENIYKMGQSNVSTSSPWIPFFSLIDVNFDGTLDILFDDIKMGNKIDQGSMPLIYLNDGFAHFEPIFASDLLDSFPEKKIGSNFNDFFNQASSFSGKDGVSWINKFVWTRDEKIYFRELIPTKPLPQIVKITATNGADKIIGNLNNNILHGLAGDDNIYGGSGNDLIYGGIGNDIIIGGSGIDISKYDKTYLNYTTKNSNSGFSVTDSLLNGSDSDNLIDVERIEFLDKYLAIDLNGNAGTTAKILGAVFGKDFVQNKQYVGIGLDLLDKGMDYIMLAGLAVNVAGLTTNDQVVSTLWKNIVGTNASTADKAPFVQMLENGMNVGELAKLAAETTLNATNINLIGLTSTGLEYLPIT